MNQMIMPPFGGALGLSHTDPVGCFVAGTQKPFFFHEGLQRETGWADNITKYANKGGHLLGLCGGYQMLGRFAHDPDGLEGKPGTTKGLFLLPAETTLKSPKTTTLTRFSWNEINGAGYEIHMGQTTTAGKEHIFKITERNNVSCSDTDGCISRSNKIIGTYIHGIFDTPLITGKWLESIGIDSPVISNLHGLPARDKEYDLLAEHFEKHADFAAILKIADGEYS